MKKYPRALALMAGLLLAACGGQRQPQENLPVTPPAMTVNVTREDCPSMQVQAGMQVWWVNDDTVLLPIIVEELDEDGTVLSTGGSEIDSGGSFSMQFTKPGVYRVYCSYERDVFATVTVQ